MIGPNSQIGGSAPNSGSYITCSSPQFGSSRWFTVNFLPEHYCDTTPFLPRQIVVTGEFDSTPSHNAQIFLASGIIVIGVDDWINKLANIA